MAKKPPGFKPSVSAEAQFSRALRKVARTSGHIVEAHVDGHSLKDEAAMMKALKEYAKLIGPWATRQSVKMLEKVTRSNKTAYHKELNRKASYKESKKIGAALRSNIAETDLGETALALVNEQVALIKSIPERAGLRAQKLALEAVYNGARADEVAKELARSSKVSESQAMLIARTEVARSTAAVNQARANAVGSRQYIWHNSQDQSVREAHKYRKGKLLEGKVFDWDSPPKLDDGTQGHPGSFPNCRCYAEPIFDES